MKKELIKFCWVTVIGVVAIQPLSAGLYNLAEPPDGPAAANKEIRAIPFSQFRDQLAEWIQLGNSQFETPKRKHYEGCRHAGELKERAGQITVPEQINLSAYLIRLKEYDKAITLLKNLASREPTNFLVHANLITAHQLAGQLDRAIPYLSQVRGGGPKEWRELTKEQLEWYTRVETFHYQLVRLRYRDTLAQAKGPKSPPTVDDLFGVRFVGENGEYEAGKLASAERAKLPKDALAIVQQLLVWFPEDTRLFWLMGEILNAQGNIADAAAVFDQCRDNRRLDAPVLLQHRRILHEALAQASLVQPEPLADTSSTSPSWFAENRPILVGGGIAGLIIAMLLFLQFRVIWQRLHGKRGKNL